MHISKIGNIEQQKRERRIHSRNSPNVSKNTAHESSEKTITDIHQQLSEEIDDTVEDTTYKMPPPRHDDEYESDDEVLAQAEKEKQVVQNSQKTPVKSRRLSVFKYAKEHKSLQKDISATVRVQDPKSMQYVPKPAEVDTKPKKIFQTKISPLGFVAMIDNFNQAQRRAIRDMGFGGFLHLQVTELPRDLCKWLVDRFDPYSITFYMSPDKRIKITPMDVYLILALPIGRRKVKEFYDKKSKDAKYNKILDAW
ncbi:hypothetical protein Cgig2_019979 [Carnegiea gigantea]|uniref:Uncharacterized protein n=1 Tax=Carnegiea gigantea TaxID=171969 RepID=A0A9Q1Q9W9_9CARY|nr:hypothetical protein Cgig2_019979 [Carnegiea gigantea]